MVYQYDCDSPGHYPSSCLLFKAELNFVDLFVPHKRKHITSHLQAEQVNDMYRIVTMVY
jgi:predicted transport protein